MGIFPGNMLFYGVQKSLCKMSMDYTAVANQWHILHCHVRNFTLILGIKCKIIFKLA